MTTDKATIYEAKVVEWCRAYSGEPFMAVLADPPYHLTSISDRYKTISARDERVKNADPYRRTGRGFMGKQWDGGDVAFRPETWEAIASVCHPGALIFAFAGTRGYHRQAVAMEDAGLIIHPLIAWAFGSGFPKATRNPDERFSGHRYGLQAMKPAIEPIAVAQVPYRGKPRDCMSETGAGAFHIDAGRVGNAGNRRRHGGGSSELFSERGNLPEYDGGRWPANLILDEEAAALMDSQSGVLTSGNLNGETVKADNGIYNTAGATLNRKLMTRAGDSGGASRFFFQTTHEYEHFEKQPMKLKEELKEETVNYVISELRKAGVI